MELKVAREVIMCSSPQHVSVPTPKGFVQQSEPLGLQNGVSELAAGVQYSSMYRLCLNNDTRQHGHSTQERH